MLRVSKFNVIFAKLGTIALLEVSLSVATSGHHFGTATGAKHVLFSLLKCIGETKACFLQELCLESNYFSRKHGVFCEYNGLNVFIVKGLLFYIKL